MKRIRTPSNWDNDDEVDTYKAQKAQRKADQEFAKEVAKNARKSKPDVMDEISKKVSQIVDNIRNGDSPIIPITRAYMIVQNSKHVGTSKSVLVLGFYDHFVESADYKLFKSLFSSEFGMSDRRFAAQKRHGKTVATAVKGVVDDAVQQSMIPTDDSARLKRVFFHNG